MEVALLSVRQLHAFRHGRVSVLQARGVPSDLVKEWVGHSSLQTTSRYTHFDHEYKQRAACAVALRMEEKLRDGPLGPAFEFWRIPPKLANRMSLLGIDGRGERI